MVSQKVRKAVFARGPSLVIASPFGPVILSVSEESRFSGQAPAKQSDEVVARAKPVAIQSLFNARNKLRNLGFKEINNFEIAASLRSSQ